ncbi:hypothetical protein G6L12_08075 [Agrobacterium rhizogenes]|nr:hypothetical protein [Rhizobium rhizogenes]NTF74429.1 hypothetical protein [Rhizobium rhizogenes]
MNMSEHQKQGMREAIEKLDAVMALAKSNFPRDTNIVIKTSGSDQSASITIPWHALKPIVAAGRAALADDGGREKP